MSYDMHLLRVPPGGDVCDVLDHHLERQAGRELNPGSPDAEKEAEKQRLASALLNFNPSLSVAQFDYAGIARLEQISEREARERYRHLELNADDYTGIQLTLWDDSADVTFPYWHSGTQAREVLQQVWEYLDVLQRWGGFVIYDPQLERIIEVNSDFTRVLTEFLSGDNSAHGSGGKTRESKWKIF